MDGGDNLKSACTNGWNARPRLNLREVHSAGNLHLVKGEWTMIAPQSSPLPAPPATPPQSAGAISPAASHTALASMLRRSSRLIHTLQKERGASCALCAACSASSTATATTTVKRSEGNASRGGVTTSAAADTSSDRQHATPSSYDVDLRSFQAHQWNRSDSFVRLDEAGREQALRPPPSSSSSAAASAAALGHGVEGGTLAIPQQLYENVQQSRRDVDVALKAFLVAASTSSSTKTFPLEKSLASIRRAVNASAGMIPQSSSEHDPTDNNQHTQERNGESGIGAALRQANLTPPIEDPVEELSGIGAVLRKVASIKRTPSMEFGGDRSRSLGNKAGMKSDILLSKGPVKEGGGAGGFHPILIMFNSCISTLIQTVVVEKCHEEMEILGPAAGEQGRPHLHRTSSFASIGVGTGGKQRQFSVGGAGTKYSSSPYAESNRIRTLSGNRPSEFSRGAPMSLSKTALSSSFRNNQYEPSLRDLRTLVGSGGVPSSDPSLYVFAGSIAHQHPSHISPTVPNTLVGTDALGRTLPHPPLPSVTAVQKKHTRWGSRGGFDLPAPTYIGSYDPVAMSMVTNNTMIRSDSQATFGSGNSGSAPNGQHLIRTFAPPSSKSLLASKSISLLSILLSFTELKESMGIERALLTSLLPQSMPVPSSNVSVVERDSSESRSASKILFSDLVLEEENQRKIIRRLRSAARAGRNADAASMLDSNGVPHGDGDVNFESLLLLVEDSARLTPEMERIQDLIRRDFNLDAFRDELSMGDFWQLITIYMDRLHATELLIIEELECCLSNPRRAENDDACDTELSGHLPGTFGAQDIGRILERILLVEGERETNKNGNEQARERCDLGVLVGRLQSMSPEKIKEQLLASLSASAIGSVPGKESELSEGSSVQFGQKRNAGAAGDSPDIISPETYTPTDWDIDCYEIEFKKRIGRGVAGTTYLAHWSGQPVAVKVAAITDLGVQGWKTECESLRQLHHPNVVRLLGSIFSPSPRTFGLVLEYCEAGDLKSALSRWTPNNFFWKVAGDIANGMSYLHRKGIIHRDIKPANVLLQGDVPSGNYKAQLADFGVAAMTQNRDEDEDLTSETGTYRWMSPEVIRHESYSFMADVYSYGVVTWQLLTHEEPFAKHTQIEAAGMVALEHARPPFPRETPAGVANLIKICWSEDPYERIPFTEIHNELQELNKSLSEEEKSWMETAFGHPVYEMPPPDVFEELNDEQNAAADIDVVKAMEKKSGALNRRTKSWSEDAMFDADGNRDSKGSKWKLSLLRKPRKEK